MPSNKSPGSYIGRFAPSPTGELHLGSLVAAMASYLDARSHSGKWLLRMEDLDPPREIPGSAQSIINSLENFGFEWDRDIVFQSQRTSLYVDHFEQLKKQQLIYRCDCSRKQLAEQSQIVNGEQVYPGNCRDRKLQAENDIAWRVKTEAHNIGFTDAVLGTFNQSVQKEVGDFVIKRKDELFSYQFAVVIDDGLQEITHVVRGADLLSSTPRQMHLQQLLEFYPPSYAHIPLVLDSKGEKFSKSSDHGKKLENNLDSLIQAWSLLGQQEANRQDFSSKDDFWNWAIKNWDMKKVPHQEQTYADRNNSL